MKNEYKFGDRFGRVAVVREYNNNEYSLTVYGQGLYTTYFDSFGKALLDMCNYGDFRRIQREFGRVYVLTDGTEVLRIWDV